MVAAASKRERAKTAEETLKLIYNLPPVRIVIRSPPLSRVGTKRVNSAMLSGLRRRAGGSSVTALLEAAEPLSTAEQDEVLLQLEADSARFNAAAVAALSVLQGLVGLLFLWLLAARGEVLMAPSSFRAGQLQYAARLGMGPPAAAAYKWVQGLQGVLLLTGGIGLSYYGRQVGGPAAADGGEQVRGEAETTAEDPDDAKQQRRPRGERRGGSVERRRRVGKLLQLVLSGFAGIASVWHAAGVETAALTPLEAAAVWALCWWQPVFHLFVAHVHDMVSATEAALLDLHRSKYKHEKI